MKPFIDFNTSKRKAAANSYEKDFFKLMIHAVFGKSLENVRKRIDFQLVSNEQKLKKVASTPRLKRMIRYTDDLVGLALRHMTKVYTFHVRYTLASLYLISAN